MPWSPAQHRLFEAAAHDPGVSKRVGIPQAKAATMAAEGVKGGSLADRLGGRKKQGRLESIVKKK